MKYYAIYEITGTGSKKLVGYVSREQRSLDRLADNAEGIPVISPESAAKKLGCMMAENRKWCVMEGNKNLVGASFGSGSRHNKFYNDSCIDNYAILHEQAEKLSAMVEKLEKQVKQMEKNKTISEII